MTRYRRWMIALGALAALTGCPGGGQSGDDDPTDGQPIADGEPGETPDAGPPTCEALPGWIVAAVEAPAPCIGRVPVPGERVTAADGRLILAELDLPLVGGDCDMLEASGCALDAEAGDRREVTATLDVAAGRLVLDGQRVDGYRADECAPVAITLAPEPMGCLLGGLFDVPTPPTLAEGMCDLSWSEATVAIAADADGTGEIRWGDRQDLDVTAIDREACTVTAEGGFLIFNGSARTIRLTATIDGDRADFSIEDALDETSDFGEECPGARFVGQGSRLGPDGPALVTTCDPLPFICGDGVCAADAGEQCENCPDDCGCEGAACLRYADPDDAEDAPPRYACAADCDGRECPADQRCVYPGEFDGFFIDGFSQRVCLPAMGEAPRGGACADSRACADGLVCSAGQCFQRCNDVDRATCEECRMLFSIPVELCLPRCDPEVTDQCGAGYCASRTLNEFCSTVDRETWFCLPEFIEYGCLPGTASGFGEPCGDAPDNGCAVDLACVGESCDRDENNRFECGVERCSRRCETDDDCAEPLGMCTSIEVPGDAPRRWCTGPR